MPCRRTVKRRSLLQRSVTIDRELTCRSRDEKASGSASWTRRPWNTAGCLTNMCLRLLAKRQLRSWRNRLPKPQPSPSGLHQSRTSGTEQLSTRPTARSSDTRIRGTLVGLDALIAGPDLGCLCSTPLQDLGKVDKRSINVLRRHTSANDGDSLLINASSIP